MHLVCMYVCMYVLTMYPFVATVFPTLQLVAGVSNKHTVLGGSQSHDKSSFTE